MANDRLNGGTFSVQPALTRDRLLPDMFLCHDPKQCLLLTSEARSGMHGTVSGVHGDLLPFRVHIWTIFTISRRYYYDPQW